MSTLVHLVHTFDEKNVFGNKNERQNWPLLSPPPLWGPSAAGKRDDMKREKKREIRSCGGLLMHKLWSNDDRCSSRSGLFRDGCGVVKELKNGFALRLLLVSFAQIPEIRVVPYSSNSKII